MVLSFRVRGCEPGVRHSGEVPGGAFDAESEEVADAADVTAGGVDLVEDSVLAQGSGSDGAVLPGEGVPARDEPRRGASVDEQVRVGAVGPGLVAVVEPGCEPALDGCGERDVAAVETEATVDDVGELEFADLFAGSSQMRV